MSITKNYPLVVIVGRTNVGKSTLFNRLIEKRKALVSEIPGTTRDLNYGLCVWRNKKFLAVDTGGLMEIKLKNYQAMAAPIAWEVEKRAREIMSAADLILLMVDAKTGILKNDRLIANLLKKNHYATLLLVNKIDNSNNQDFHAFQELGLGTPQAMAAASGKGVGDLLDTIFKKLKTTKKIKKEKIDLVSVLAPTKKQATKICLIGKPNVGKSSLLNQMLGMEKAIVSPIPHTTREPQDTFLEFEEEAYQLIDTAGIRRKAQVEKSWKNPTLESAGIAMSIATMKKADLALLIIDLTEGITDQDTQLAQLAINSGLSIIIVANKYDQLEKNMANASQIITYIHSRWPFLTWAPIIFTAANNGKNCQKILPLIKEIMAERQKKISAKELKEFFQYLIKKMPPPRQEKNLGGKKSRSFVTSLTQKKAERPIFLMTAINKIKMPESYLRYIENNLRSRFKFSGTPIKVVVERDLP